MVKLGVLAECVPQIHMYPSILYTNHLLYVQNDHTDDYTLRKIFTLVSSHSHALLHHF